MDSQKGANFSDIWSEIVASEQQQKPEVQVIYTRRKNSTNTPQDLPPSEQLGLEVDGNRNRLSLAAPNPNKRISWNRSLSTRGRTSIAVGYCVVDRPQVKQAKKRGKPPLPKRKVLNPPNFDKERAYFEEVDAFELLEESPSPKNYGKWVKANQNDDAAMPHLTSRLHDWIRKRLNHSCGPSSTLSRILGTPNMTLTPIRGDEFEPLAPEATLEKSTVKINSILNFIERASLGSESILEKDASKLKKPEDNLEHAVKKLSLGSTCSLENEQFNFATLLAVCGQSGPSKFQDVFSKYCDPQKITKIGEGTFGEAFMAGTYVCKIVPIDGDFRVNGEVQKRSVELLEEVVLSRTLNCLRESKEEIHNACTGFIETIDLKVCQGAYDANLINAWQEWDEKNGSENDHPKEFPDNQCYVVFVLAHGGKDLESFVLFNYDEARTLLVQVTAALAVAEAAYEFEHRDLHWGNVLLSRNDSVTLSFTLKEKKMSIKTFGLSIQIIDFTLSRINTGEDILFLDLSSDPYLFKGPKGDKQSETYRKMKEVTDDCWEGSFPRTNVLWLQYLVDILLLKKSFERNSKNERDLRSLKKRLDKYQSSREAILDSFFSDLIVNNLE